jgi:hypothetical protein
VRAPAVLLAGLALGAWTAGSCGARPPAPVAAACTPPAGTLPAGARADAMAGEFRLTLTATRGPQAGRSTAAALRLLPFGSQPSPVPAAPGTRYPLYGGTDVALADVGAVTHGAASPEDAAGPGVLVMEWPRPNAPVGTHEVMLRLGAEANQGSERPFDGAYTALTVTEIAAGRFAGTWESGGGDTRAGGYFCADRVAPR